MNRFKIGDIVSFSYLGNLIEGEIINQTCLFYEIKITKSELENIGVGSLGGFSHAIVEQGIDLGRLNKLREEQHKRHMELISDTKNLLNTLDKVTESNISNTLKAFEQKSNKSNDFIYFKDSEFIIKKDEIKSLGIIYGSKQIDIKTGLEKPNFYKIVVNNDLFIDYFEHKEEAQEKLKEISKLLNCVEV